ncbi:MAG: cysteine desulfurase [Acidobacteria bacterium]|nr:cysteine desulfurase [Acidobacteriota bacterium]
MPERFYFDHNATTPLSDEAFEAMTAALREVCGNASSIHHYGQMAKQRLEMARRQVAALIGASPKEIVFTSGGTEANNLALFGATKSGSHVVTSAIEHPAVLSPCARLEQLGVPVTYVKAGADGIVDPDAVRRALRPDTALVSIMHANNETGAVQPVAEIARITRQAGVLLHVDGVQAAGKIPVSVTEPGADLYSLSAHKLYAPKGIGALYVRSGVPLQPQMLGGHHERDRRAGTENVPSAAAFGSAAEWLSRNGNRESARVASLRDLLERGILERVPDVTINGSAAHRLPNTANLRFHGIEGEAMVIALDLRGFAVSSGSACSSGAVEPSHVLLAMGFSPDQARSSVRFSLGRSNTAGQVETLIEAVADSVRHLRRVSPAYSNA